MFKLLLSALIVLGLSTPALTPAPTNLLPRYTQADEGPVMPEDQLPEATQAQVDTKLQGIRLVNCGNKKEKWRGSTVHYSNLRYLTANHVVQGGVCFDALTGLKLKTIYQDKANDFAILEAPYKLDNTIYALSCEPFKTGKPYWSVGWAGGESLTNQDLVAKKKYTNPFFIIEGAINDHLREFEGYIIPGMSGGAVFDDKWVVHGINNASWEGKNISWSRELRDTVICSK